MLAYENQSLRWPGIEPGSIAWKAAMLTTIPPSLPDAGFRADRNRDFVFLRVTFLPQSSGRLVKVTSGPDGAIGSGTSKNSEIPRSKLKLPKIEPQIPRLSELHLRVPGV